MNQSNGPEIVNSPCNNRYKIDEETNICQSCLRTIEEIFVWDQISNGERRQIITAIEQRRRENR